MKVHLTMKSSNKKTGRIPVSTTEPDSCPPTCPLKNGGGCYAESGPLLLHWRKVGQDRNTHWGDFCGKIKSLPLNQLWRHNQAGDMPAADGMIDAEKVLQLIAANRGKRGFTYTHHDPVANADIISKANADGFTINLSGDNATHADSLAALGIAPVVTLLPEDAPKVSHTPSNRKIVRCPATNEDSEMTCERCGLCARADRGYIIGFPVHGTRKKAASSVAIG